MLKQLIMFTWAGCLPLFSASGHAANPSAPWIGKDLTGRLCEGKSQGYGPYDYSTADGKKRLGVVEEHHFTRKVEALKSGESGYIDGDLDYTLRAFPNHHRALNAMMGYQELRKPLHPEIPRIECYLQRAVHFAPHDSVPFMLYGIYLHKHGHLQQALDQYRQAEKIQPEHSELLYNLGLLLLDLKQPGQARDYARKAHNAGYPLAGLSNKLRQIGYPP